jgi:3-hydroxyisobutyrate dehydrogenase-like beta-hydroxyacid dehydrogenase
VLDAQMTGAQRGVIERNLLFMVGGDADVLERCRPALLASASHIIHMGPLGMGAVTKVAQQAITVVNLLAATEGIRLAQKAGIDLEAFYQVLSLSTAQSHVIDQRMGFPPSLGGSRSGPGRDPRPFYRGLRAVLGLAFDLDEPMPATALAQQTVPWALAPDDA